MRLVERQREFARALLDPVATVPSGIVGPDGLPSSRRFAVYRNNVVVGLVEALRANFPATYRLVGEEFFQAMAREFVVRKPPNSPILLDYGVAFPDFVEGFEPAESLPYLPDVARIERAWTESYNAPEALALCADAFADLPKDQTPSLRFELHPSLRLVRPRFPALTIWRMNVADGVPAPIDLEAGGEDALLVRPDADVEVRLLPPGGAEFIVDLSRGHSLADAVKAAMSIPSSFDLAANLETLISAGVFVGFSLRESADAALVGLEMR
ncbi:MAG: DUF2063 domain-containing protein [Variibacter sp.]